MASQPSREPTPGSRPLIPEVLETTQSLCPTCLVLLDARVVEREGRVYLERSCPAHGPITALLSTDAARYRDAHRWNRPGQPPRHFATGIQKGCPFDCGLCPDHQQHSCVAVLEVTRTCNLRCPTCFSSSGPEVPREFLSRERVGEMLDALVRAEPSPGLVQFSGGEPSLHPEILELMDLAREKGVKHVFLNTNGVRLARDEGFVKELARRRALVYLQFDGLRRETHMALRGADLREVKSRALANLSRHGVGTVLVATVQKGVNEDEVGAVADLALRTPAVRGAVFQPTFYQGRHPDFDPADRVTLPDVVRAIASGSGAGLQPGGFTPIPCCYPTCSAACLAYVAGGKITPLNRFVDIPYYLDYVANRAFVDAEGMVKEALESLYSAGVVPGSKEMLQSYCVACQLPLDSSLLTSLQERVKILMVQPFMDAWTFDVRRAKKCCIQQVLPDGRIVPFCVHNTLYR